MKMDKFKLNNPSTNWKYVLIVIILALITGGFLTYQYFLTQREIKEEIQITPPIKVSQEKYIEVPLEELKEGENEIDNVTIEKIKPRFLCDGVNMCYVEWDYTNDTYNIECCKEISHRYERGIKLPQCEFICNVEDKAKVKMIGELAGPGEEYFLIDSFSVIDKEENIVDTQGEEGELFFTQYAIVEFFNFDSKTYFLIRGNKVVRGEKPKKIFFLYVIDKEGKVKFVALGPEKIGYALKYKNNLYLRIGNEIWEFDENDVLKNKFPANKIIIKNKEISFE
jgi:uncharacterized protein YneF (UPF0154 family)